MQLHDFNRHFFFCLAGKCNITLQTTKRWKRGYLPPCVWQPASIPGNAVCSIFFFFLIIFFSCRLLNTMHRNTILSKLHRLQCSLQCFWPLFTKAPVSANFPFLMTLLIISWILLSWSNSQGGTDFSLRNLGKYD